MRVHWIQHVPFEGLGEIGVWLAVSGHITTATRLWEDETFPELDKFDLLIIMGGPMGVYDDNTYSWLSAEKRFIHSAAQAKKRIVGICLGAQLLACVLGAQVVSNKEKEIGWFPVTFSASFSEWLGESAPDELNVFHWHGDKFEIPPAARNHASSAGCAHQLFTVGSNIIGLQFHLEANAETVASMLDNDGGEVIAGAYIQSRQDIVDGLRHAFDAQQLLKKILRKICS